MQRGREMRDVLKWEETFEDQQVNHPFDNCVGSSLWCSSMGVCAHVCVCCVLAFVCCLHPLQPRIHYKLCALRLKVFYLVHDIHTNQKLSLIIDHTWKSACGQELYIGSICINCTSAIRTHIKFCHKSVTSNFNHQSACQCIDICFLCVCSACVIICQSSFACVAATMMSHVSKSSVTYTVRA